MRTTLRGAGSAKEDNIIVFIRRDTSLKPYFVDENKTSFHKEWYFSKAILCGWKQNLEGLGPAKEDNIIVGLAKEDNIIVLWFSILSLNKTRSTGTESQTTTAETISPNTTRQYHAIKSNCTNFAEPVIHNRNPIRLMTETQWHCCYKLLLS